MVYRGPSRWESEQRRPVQELQGRLRARTLSSYYSRRLPVPAAKLGTALTLKCVRRGQLTPDDGDQVREKESGLIRRHSDEGCIITTMCSPRVPLAFPLMCCHSTR
jgi:hypothetical protein